MTASNKKKLPTVTVVATKTVTVWLLFIVFPVVLSTKVVIKKTLGYYEMLNVISDLTRNLEQYSFCNFWSMYSSFFFDRKLKGDVVWLCVIQKTRSNFKLIII